MQVHDRALRAPDAVRGLHHLLRHISGKLRVMWDRVPIYRAQVVKDFLAQGAAVCLQLEQLPAYAPECKPAEGIWQLSSASHAAMSAVTISPNCGRNSAWRPLACGTSARSCTAASRERSMRFTSFRRDQ